MRTLQKIAAFLAGKADAEIREEIGTAFADPDSDLSRLVQVIQRGAAPWFGVADSDIIEKRSSVSTIDPQREEALWQDYFNWLAASVRGYLESQMTDVPELENAKELILLLEAHRLATKERRRSQFGERFNLWKCLVHTAVLSMHPSTTSADTDLSDAVHTTKHAAETVPKSTVWLEDFGFVIHFTQHCLKQLQRLKDWEKANNSTFFSEVAQWKLKHYPVEDIVQKTGANTIEIETALEAIRDLWEEQDPSLVQSSQS